LPPPLEHSELKEAIDSDNNDKDELEKELLFVSSGWWTTIDKVSSLGLSTMHDNLKLSTYLRSIRKECARATGMHGILSGKHRNSNNDATEEVLTDDDLVQDERWTKIRTRIEKARTKIAKENSSESHKDLLLKASNESGGGGGRLMRRIIRNRRRKEEKQRKSRESDDGNVLVATKSDQLTLAMRKKIEENEEEAAEEEVKRKIRVMEIDHEIVREQTRIRDLQVEKDALQRRPNPLFDYTATANITAASFSGDQSIGEGDGRNDNNDDETEAAEVKLVHKMTFNFPEKKFVKEYIKQKISSGQFVMLNHTTLWRSNGHQSLEEDGIDDSIGNNDLLNTPSTADIRNLYHRSGGSFKRKKQSNNGNSGGNGGMGSWFLRGGYGEKIGKFVENAAYEGVTNQVMSTLARFMSSLHGINILEHSDIRLYMDLSPDLPSDRFNNNNNQATEEAMQAMLKRGSMRNHNKKKKKKGEKQSSSSRQKTSSSFYSDREDASFLQRDAIVETFISHCQISAPLLKKFPIAWQRALFSNIVSLVCFIVADFAAGIRVQLLGHMLTFTFRPLTEEDVIFALDPNRPLFNNKAKDSAEFEAAVRATAADVSNNLTFLDKWHERFLGGKVVRDQVGNIIARTSLSIVDEVLCGLQIDLWSRQVGGPRILAAMEHRPQSANEHDAQDNK